MYQLLNSVKTLSYCWKQMDQSMTGSGHETKKIMCINADLQVAQLIGTVFNDSPIVKKLESNLAGDWEKLCVIVKKEIQMQKSSFAFILMRF